MFQFSPLPDAEMREFAAARGVSHVERRLALAQGSPGLALSLDLEVYAKRRGAMVLLLEVIAGTKPFASWIPVSETIGRSRTKTRNLSQADLRIVSRLTLNRDRGETAIRNQDLKRELTGLSPHFPAERIVAAVPHLDTLSNWCVAISRKSLLSIT